MDNLTTWREIILDHMKSHLETWADVVACTLTEEELDVKFYAGFGSSAGEPFTLWTKRRVYFPAVYDGAEWAEIVSRDPDGKPTLHVGGE